MPTHLWTCSNRAKTFVCKLILDAIATLNWKRILYNWKLIGDRNRTARRLEFICKSTSNSPIACGKMLIGEETWDGIMFLLLLCMQIQ
jgi:hypothetical protein